MGKMNTDMSWATIIVVAVGSVIGGVAAVVFAPVLLSALGFTASGLAPKSIAAMMASNINMFGTEARTFGLWAMKSAGEDGVGFGTAVYGAVVGGATAYALKLKFFSDF